MTSTDNFPHDDDEHKMGSDEGDWVSSEPPVDDFDDSSTETATVSEGEEHPQEEVATDTVEEKKKFPVLLLVGAVGALAVLGGFAFWQFGSHGQEPNSLLDMAAQNQAPQPAAPDFASKPLAQAPASAEAPATSPAASANVAPTTSFSAPVASPDVANTSKLPPQQAGAATPTATGAPSLTSPAAVATNAVAQAPAQAPLAAPAPVLPQANVPADARLTTLATRIDDLQKSLGQATQQLGQINDKLSVAQSMPSSAAPVPSQNNLATEERLNKLEQKLLQVEQHQVASDSRTVSPKEVSPVRTGKKSKHVVKHKVVLSKKNPSPPHENAEPKWVLRAAAPDEVWVATGQQTRDLRPVRVGDELAGIGKVKSIQQVDGGWVVQGSTGILR